MVLFRKGSICLFSLLGLSFSLSSSTFAHHPWGTYHWARKTSQFTLLLGNNLIATSTSTTPWTTLLQNTSQDWNNPQNATVKSYTGPTPILTSVITGAGGTNCSAVSGTTQVCNKTYGLNGWLGLAQISVSGSHILQGVAKMNDTYFNTSSYNTNNEKLHVMCQEVAHTFGLGHQSTDGSSQNSCMDYFSNTGGNAGSTLSIKPNYHDFEQLASIYKHLDTTNTYATLSTAKAAAKPLPDLSDDPKSWGTLMRQSPEGRSSTYEIYIGQGIRILTHVTWTAEKAAKCTYCDHRYHD